MIVLSKYKESLHTKPIITKAITQFFLFGAGDLLCQIFEKTALKKKTKKFDFLRIFKQASFGFLFAPYGHYHFCKIIPFFFPRKIGQNANLLVLKQTTYDQTIHASFFTIVFYFWIGLLNSKKSSEIMSDIKLKFLPTMIENWKIWPLAMIINYKYIPPQYSLLYTNIIGLFWMTYLSYLQNIRFAKPSLDKPILLLKK